MSFSLEIISPQQTVFNDEIELCILPGIEGDFGILKTICRSLPPSELE